MGQVLSRKPRSWYSKLSVSDEAWFSLGGHVFNRKNTVLYAPGGGGTPEQWFSEASQAQNKVMVFCVLHGSGKKFGPYFHDENENINQHSYRHLLQSKVFPQMKRCLGQELFSQTTWQQDARFLKVCRYDQLRRNSCYDKLGCNNLVVIALLLRPA